MGSIHCKPREGRGNVDTVHHRPRLRLIHRTPIVHREPAAMDSGPTGAQQRDVAQPGADTCPGRPSLDRPNPARIQPWPSPPRPGLGPVKVDH
jgi:hypothetical protein